MIRSSADILRILGGDSVVRLLASVQIVDSKPPLTGEDGTFIYIDRFPSEQEFEATWRIWVRDYADAPIEVLIDRLKALLPNLRGKETTMGWDLSTTDFKSESTQTKPSKAPAVAPQADLSAIEARFEALAEDIQDQMLLVNSGRPGKNGERGPEGRPGAPGRDGKDLVATDAHLDDLKDVEISSAIPLQKGQVLMYDGVQWTNRFSKSSSTIIGGGGGGSTTLVTGQVGSTIVWQYHEETGEPHHRKFHTHGESQADLVTLFHVSKKNEAGNDVELLLDALLPLSGQIYVASEEDPSQAHLYTVDSYVETADGFELSVTHVETPGPEPSFNANENYSFLFLPSASTTDGIPEAPQDGGYYVRQNGQWVELIVALGAYDNRDFDGGNWTTGVADSVDGAPLDGGDFTS